MAEHSSIIEYKFKIGDKDFEYKETFSSYKVSDLSQLLSNDKNLKSILQDKIFIESQKNDSNSDFNDFDAFDYISQFNLLFSTYKKYDSENISKVYKATEKLRELIYREKIHLSLLNNYENLDKIESEITNEDKQNFNDFFTALKSSFEDESLSLQDLIKRINENKYPDDFRNTLKAINKVINQYVDNKVDKYDAYRKIDKELYKYVKIKPLLLNKVIYAKKVLNHLTTTSSYLNKYMSAICGTSSISKTESTSYEYLLNKIQNSISKHLSSLNISSTSPGITTLLNKKLLKSIYNLTNRKMSVCIALLIDPIQNYYSFNGDDYIETEYKELKDIFDSILSGENFKYAKQQDMTRSFYGKKETSKPYWKEANKIGAPQYFITYLEHKDTKKIFTCCERKILTEIGYIDSHEYNFYIVFEPCENCEAAIEYATLKNNAKFNIQCFDNETGKLKKYETKSYEELYKLEYFN